MTATESTAASLALSPGQRSALVALMEMSDTTVIALAEAAGVSKSTVAKALIRLETAGLAKRTVHETDDGARFADTWSATAATGVYLMGSAVIEPSYGHAQALLTVGDPSAYAETATTQEVRDDVPDDRNLEPMAASHSTSLAADETSDGAAVPAPESQVPAQLTQSDTGSSERLKPGMLQDLVTAYMAANPQVDFTASALAKEIGKSSGAIANALVVMESKRSVVMTCDKPRRYRHAPSA